ncbi:MAG: putative penicillin-binding protein [Parcubacteria group bacterium]|nr:putative penicillin-binding protein [Parcubacteria group bacterium]
MKERRKDNRLRNKLFIVLTILLVLTGGVFLWIASFRIPDLSDLSERKVLQSTKIYDRTGNVLLYDMAQNVRRTIIPFDQISPNVKKATLAIEDHDFYTHGGINITSLVRAVLVDLTTFSFNQGGSTITQQVVKNTILTGDKTPTRKLKEMLLAIKLDKALPKDEILNLYLNEIPYGGSIYGVEEAAQSFFGKPALNLTLPESAYLAAMQNAPTFYSPYGNHIDALEARKNLVFKEMLSNKLITQEEYDVGIAEKVTFKPKTSTSGIRAPHFVFFVIDYLAKKYGEDLLQTGGLKITTTIDADIQAKAEELGKQYGVTNLQKFHADNNAIVVIDPKSGDILAMTGSKDYFDKTINGNFNVATAHRQPGSTFKPFVYSTLFNKGYTPNTILFDAATQFSANCASNNFTSDNGCYSPVDYDGTYRGPMTIRNALAQSINVPAVKALYLAGMQASIDTAASMGLTGLGSPSQYGLSLVLGGGEVTPLDMTSAYSVFANDGMRNPYNAVLKIQEESGKVIEQYTPNPTRVLPEESARKISSILSDNAARTPAYGSNSVLYVPTQDVAVKTGTTNDYKDAWIMGYTPNITVGMWVGNNENTPMDKKVAGYIVAPMWRDMMNYILPKFPVESFTPPLPDDPTLKPVLRNDLAGEAYTGGIHNILHFVNKNDPTGPAPSNPTSDPQYTNWEYGVQAWLAANPLSLNLLQPQTQMTPVIQNGIVVPTSDPNIFQTVTYPAGTAPAQ